VSAVSVVGDEQMLCVLSFEKMYNKWSCRMISHCTLWMLGLMEDFNYPEASELAKVNMDFLLSCVQ
jgi:hypothetical protein